MPLIASLALFLLLAAGLPAGVSAQPLMEVEEGVHYEEIDSPVPTGYTDRIEVVEMFWYGCPECYDFEPMIQEWEAEAAGDVVFARNTAIRSPVMETHARIFHAAAQTGRQDRIHASAFNALHEQGNPLRTREQAEDLFTAAGVDSGQFNDIWNSQSVTAAVEEAESLTRNYGVQKTPAMIVDGRYRVTLNSAVSTRRDMLITVNLLIKELRDVRRAD